MNAAGETASDPREFFPAPFQRRVGAALLDSAAALLIIYSATFLFSSAQNIAPTVLVLWVGLNQALVVGWTLFKDAWWPGQGVGKRMASVLIVQFRSNAPASRLRCVWRQAVFSLLVLVVYLPLYLNSFPSPAVLPQAVISSLLSVAMPVRLPIFLLPEQQAATGELFIAHMLVLGFILLEALLAFTRPGGRRIVDFLAGTRVVDGKGVNTP